MQGRPAPLSGRRAQAARNDVRILEAARAVFVADPDAPISDVATRAGVGNSAIYRRYGSKEELLRKLSGDGLQSYIRAAEVALADDGDTWAAFTTFMRSVVDADVHAVGLRLAGAFSPTEELRRAAEQAQQLNVQLVEHAKASGGLRPDLAVDDLSFLFEQLSSVRVPDEARTIQLRHRYLALLLDALRASSTIPLPGPPPSWREVRERWEV
jgi:AcrR family transcriptional regulator